MNKPSETSQLGQRQTRQPDAIFQVIEKTSEPLAVEEIHQRAKNSLPPLDIATVYRTLRLSRNMVIKSRSRKNDASSLRKLSHKYFSPFTLGSDW